MTTFSTDIKINAPIETVWQALANIGDISVWNPGVVESHLTTDQGTGLGAQRYCNLGGNNYLDEEVVEWEEGKRLTMRIIGTNLPFKNADIRFTLQADNDGTLVTVSPDYTLKFGPIGALLDLVYVRGNYLKGMKGLLKGLKQHLEK